MIGELVLGALLFVSGEGHPSIHPARADVYVELPDVPAMLRAYASAPLVRLLADPELEELAAAAGSTGFDVATLLARGGLRPLDKFFEMSPEFEKLEDSQKWINESGLVVAFVVDGQAAPVTAAYKAFLEALKTGADKKAVGEAFKALEAEIVKNEAELRKFAGI